MFVFCSFFVRHFFLTFLTFSKKLTRTRTKMNMNTNNTHEEVEVDHNDLQNFFFQQMDEEYYGVNSFDDLKDIMAIQLKFAQERLVMNKAFDELTKIREHADNADNVDKPVSVVQKKKLEMDDKVQEIPSVLTACEQKKHRDAITSIMPLLRRKKHAAIGRKSKAIAKAKK